MGKNSFTLEELMVIVKKEHPNYTDEEIEASVHILEHEGFIRKISRDIYEQTGKRP